MSTSHPFSLRIFVADGDPDGLRLVDRSNWIGKAVMFPRALYTKVRNREEFKQTGVYLLIGPQANGDGETIYIGEGDPVRPRLEEHYAKKDFWTRAVFVVAGPGQLNKAHVQYLEAELVARALAAKRVPLENGNHPAQPTLSEADRADMDVFLQNILGMLPLLGINAFEQPTSIPPGSSKVSGQTLLTCKGKGVTATGYDTAQGFVVKQGSEAVGVADEAPSMAQHVPTVARVRHEVIQSGVLQVIGNRLQFSQDFTFNSPSLAASVVLGRSSNGRMEWKDAGGKTLKDIQAAQADLGDGQS